jgi:hypothetical protein
MPHAAAEIGHQSSWLHPPLCYVCSTGKYSTKQTAKRRYLPRIKRGLVAFEDLEKTLKTDKYTPLAQTHAHNRKRALEDETHLHDEKRGGPCVVVLLREGACGRVYWGGS